MHNYSIGFADYNKEKNQIYRVYTMPQPSQLTFSIFVICMYVYIGFNFGQRIFVLQRYLSLALAGFVVPLFVALAVAVVALAVAVEQHIVALALAVVVASSFVVVDLVVVALHTFLVWVAFVVIVQHLDLIQLPQARKPLKPFVLGFVEPFVMCWMVAFVLVRLLSKIVFVFFCTKK